MGRLRKRFNWKGRLSESHHSEETEQPKEVVKLDLDVKDEKYDSCNPFVLPSEKIQKEKPSSQPIKKIKSLSKKKRKKLEKILEKKRKKVNRAEILEKLQEVQATPDELKLMVSTSDMQTSGLKKNIPKSISTNSNDLRVKRINTVKRGKRKNRDLLENEEKKAKFDPNVVGFESYSDDTTDSESELDKSEKNSKSINYDEVTVSNKLSLKLSENNGTAEKTEACVDKTEKVNLNISKKFKEKSENDSVSKERTPAVFVPVDRSPEIQSIREALPIYCEEYAIMEAVNEHSVVIIHGDTGTGKTTQVPQFLYEAGYTRNKKMIGITEPRRIAAVSMANRVAEEMNLPDAVSYHIRYEKTATDDKTEIKFMTDGVLLKEMRQDFFLSKYSVIIIDEAHERSIFSDVLIGLLSRVLPLREKRENPLKLIIMSATLRIDDFVDNPRLFKVKPFLIKLNSRQYDVILHFNTKTPVDYIEAAYKKVCKIHQQLPPGGILVFVTGEKEVTRLCKMLRKAFPLKGSTYFENVEEKLESDLKKRKIFKRKKGKDQPFDAVPKIDLDTYSVEPLDVEGLQHQESDDENCDDLDKEIMAFTAEPLYVLPLYSLLSTEEQSKIFKPPPTGTRLCVVATNVAETSITIPGLKYVVDTGKVKTRVYDKVAGGISNFAITWTSKASANQRAGRAGRTEGGHCYRLYSSAMFEHEFPDFPLPEIQRTPVDDVLLQLKALGIDRVVNFPFPSGPDPETLKAAERRLVILGALQDLQKNQRYKDIAKWEYSAKITPLGKAMSRLPVSPRYAKMLLLSYTHSVTPYGIALVSAFSVPEVFLCSSPKQTEDPKMEENNEENQKLYAGIKKLGTDMGKSLKLGDAMVLIRAAALYEETKNKTKFCERYNLRIKAMEEIHKMRVQLTKDMNSLFKDLDVPLDLKIDPPNDTEIDKLRMIVASSMIDCVARKIPEDEVGKDKKSLRNAYKCLDLNEPVYIHPSSVLSNVMPDYVVYQEIFQTSRYFMKMLTEIEPEWLPTFAPSQCDFLTPLESPEPHYDKKTDKIMCSMSPTFGPWQWQLPCLSLPMPTGILKYKWFCYFLLDGHICPLFKAYSKLLLSPASVMMKDWARLVPRTQIFLHAISSQEVDSARALYKMWENEPSYLLKEYCEWLPNDKHAEVANKWPPSHQ